MNHSRRGFTMIELVVALAIVFLLVAVAVVSYQDHMTRKKRAEARSALVELAEWMRHQHQRTHDYLTATLPYGQIPRDGEPTYRIQLEQAPVRASDPDAVFPALTPTTFTLRAEPVEEDVCGALLLDSEGRIGVLGNGAKVAECWR
jgi:type IV pilus assembly protein PilE